jgi:RNA polymerase sigma-70 factor (ECF subfamily)
MFLLEILLWALSFSTLSVIEGENTRAEDPDEQGLLERASRADPEALGALYDRYVDRIYNYIYHRVGQVDLAEDLTAQVFARMLEAIREGRAWRTSFSGWIYRIAHNLVIDYYRRRGRAAFVELEEATPIVADEADPVRRAEARLESEHLRAALTKLTEEQAEVIALRFLDELSIAEVAFMMNKTEGAIKALQYRAVLALRRVMQPA